MDIYIYMHVQAYSTVKSEIIFLLAFNIFSYI